MKPKRKVKMLFLLFGIVVISVWYSVKNMDFTIREPRLDITSEEDRLYKKAYLKVLKNEMPTLEWEKQYDWVIWH